MLTFAPTGRSAARDAGLLCALFYRSLFAVVSEERVFIFTGFEWKRIIQSVKTARAQRNNYDVFEFDGLNIITVSITTATLMIVWEVLLPCTQMNQII